MNQNNNLLFQEKCAFATCSIKKPLLELIPCQYCKKAKYCSSKCLALDWEAWHKYSCPESLSNQGIKTPKTPKRKIAFNKKIEDFEILDVELFPNKEKAELFEQKYREEYLIVREKKSHQSFLMKILEKAKFQSESLKDQMSKSLKSHLKMLIHPHIIRLYHYFEDEQYFYMLYELVDRNLNDLFLKRKKLIEREAFVFFSQIALALDFLHKKSILHKRLIFETILLDVQSNIKLSDFGLMIDFSNSNSIKHLAPETLKDHLLTKENDIWGLGLILYQMIHGHVAFKNGELKYASFVSDDCVDLIKEMLNKVPEERITLDKIFVHSWMKKYEEVYKTKLKGYIHKEDDDNGNSDRVLRNFIPSFLSNKPHKRNNSVYESIKPDFLGGFYNRISFADEEGYEEENKNNENIHPVVKRNNRKKSKGTKDVKELEFLIKRKNSRKFSEKKSNTFSNVLIRMKTEENEIGTSIRSTNIDSNVPNELVLSEKEPPKVNSSFWDELKSLFVLNCSCISKTKK